MVLAITQIVEEANKTSDEFQARHPDIPWNETNGFRNRAIHAYGTLDLERTWDEPVLVAIRSDQGTARSSSVLNHPRQLVEGRGGRAFAEAGLNELG
ncbi:MAG: DUF86 domain-containing protein [Chloroflexi bacterium]|nr:DUF86 domain-containing protein [Chloroflexota bacterium]